MVRRLLTVFAVLCALLGVGAYLFLLYPLRDRHPAETLAAGTLVIRDAKVYVAPEETPLEHASILIRDGRIASVGSSIDIPADAQTVPCDHCIVTAGFWNSHVHFTEARWQNAAFLPVARLNAQMVEMLTSRGFTTVVDVGSDLRVTVSLRRRIESGNLLGPRIYTAGAAQYPPHGIPFYLRETLPPILQKLMPAQHTG